MYGIRFTTLQYSQFGNTNIPNVSFAFAIQITRHYTPVLAAVKNHSAIDTGLEKFYLEAFISLTGVFFIALSKALILN